MTLPTWVPSLREVIIWLFIISMVSFAIGGVITVMDGGKYKGNVTTLTVPILIPGTSISHSQVSLILEQGVLNISAGSGDTLINGTIKSKNAIIGPVNTYSTNNQTGILKIRQESTEFFDPREIEDTWDLTLHPDIPVDLSIECNAGELNINPGSCNLTSLFITCGTGDVFINLSAWNGSHLPASISLGIGSISVLVPEDASIAADTKTGVGSRTIEGLTGSEGVYFYTGSNSESSVISLSITQGVGDLTLKRDIQ